MPKVWEAYVAQRLAQLWPHHRVIAPYTFPMTADGLTAEADATVWDGDQLIALYDAKYKWPGKTADRADIYQMITYCERLGLSECTLVYPVDTAHRTIAVGTRTVHVLGLGPNTDKNSGQPNTQSDASTL